MEREKVIINNSVSFSFLVKGSQNFLQGKPSELQNKFERRRMRPRTLLKEQNCKPIYLQALIRGTPYFPQQATTTTASLWWLTNLKKKRKLTLCFIIDCNVAFSFSSCKSSSSAARVSLKRKRDIMNLRRLPFC